MNNYVQLNSLLDNEVVTLIVAICFIALIFGIGFCLGRITKIKKLEDKWDKQLDRVKKTFNEFMEEAGMPQRIDDIRREDNKS